MSLCNNCGCELGEAQVCPVCGAVTADNEAVKKVEYRSSYVINGAPGFETITSTEEERQSLLDWIGKRLTCESILWRVFSILKIVAYVSCVFLCVASFFSAIFTDEFWDDGTYYEDEYYYDGPHSDMSFVYTDEYVEDDVELTETDIYMLIFICTYFVSIFGFFYYVPGVIMGFIMAAKTRKARKKLYLDCLFAYRRCASPLSIIMGIMFNPWTLIVSIPLFVKVRRNAGLLNEIASIQSSYFGGC